MTIELLYFAWVREGIGAGAERVEPPAEVATVADLIIWLAARSEGHARAFADPSRLRAAIDQRFVSMDAPIAGAREIAIFPPVTGGDWGRMIRVQPEPLDPPALLAMLPASGAVATFTGHVRADDDVTGLTLEHYPGMTEAALEKLEQAARTRWPLEAVVLVHRIGAMAPGEAIVFVGVASAHRAAALEACAFLIDRLKTDAPFWKHEARAGESAGQWVEHRAADKTAAERWA